MIKTHNYMHNLQTNAITKPII
uniref:Uncharacterized protein n=1 Tax=Rhizophora mucronata TaxID=61149 RepID=A0A2P2Q215_RHIMU